MRAGIDLPWLAYADAITGNVEAAGRQLEPLRWVYLKDYVALHRAQAGMPDARLTTADWVALISGDTDGAIVDAVLAHDDAEPFARLMEGLFATRQYYCAC